MEFWNPPRPARLQNQTYKLKATLGKFGSEVKSVWKRQTQNVIVDWK